MPARSNWASQSASLLRLGEIATEMWSLAHESVADCMVECISKGWEFGRTSRLGEMPVMT